MTPYEWSNIVQDHFFLHTRLPCSLVFKKAMVTFSGIVFLSLKGRCKECGSIFQGIIDSVPAVDTRLVKFMFLSLFCIMRGIMYISYLYKL